MIDIEAQQAHAREDPSRPYASRMPRNGHRAVTGDNA